MQTNPRRAVLPVSVPVRALAVLLTAVALVAGCSSSKTSSAPLPDGAALLKQSTETTRGEHSAHVVITVNGKIKQLPIDTLAGDLTNTPAVAAKGTADIIMFGQKVSDVAFAVVDGILYGSLAKGGALSSFGPANNIYDISLILSPDKGLANVLAGFSDAKAVGRESVGGSDAVKITGTLSADAVNSIAPPLKVTGTVPGTAWIREDGNHELAQVSFEVTPGNSVQMTLSDWGKPVTVDKPAA